MKTNKEKILVVTVALVVLALLIAAIRGGTISLKGTPIAKEVRVEFPAPGTTLVTLGGQPDKATLLLAASTLWAKTGLKLNPSSSVAVTASGSANLAVHRLIDSAIYDTKPHLGWVGPAGGKVTESRAKDTYRQKLKIDQLVEDGVLLAYLQKEGDADPGKYNPKPDGLIVIGAHGVIANKTPDTRTIWLVINDAVLSDTELAKKAYLEIDREDDPTIKVRPNGYNNYDESEPKSWTAFEHWQYVQKNQYWELWFDDNVGFYQVQFDFSVR